MKKAKKVMVGLLVAVLVVIPLGIVAVNAQPRSQSHTIVRIADVTVTPPNGGGGQCHGGGC